MNRSWQQSYESGGDATSSCGWSSYAAQSHRRGVDIVQLYRSGRYATYLHGWSADAVQSHGRGVDVAQLYGSDWDAVCFQGWIADLTNSVGEAQTPPDRVGEAKKRLFSILVQDKCRNCYERDYITTPGFGHSPWGKLMVEMFKFFQHYTSVGTVGRKPQQLAPDFKNAI